MSIVNFDNEIKNIIDTNNVIKLSLTPTK